MIKIMARLGLAFRNFFKRKSTYGLLSCLLCMATFIFYFAPLPLTPAQKSIHEAPAKHNLCVLVPFRDTYEELLEFIPHISRFLNRQSIAYHIVVVNHVSDGNRFNKGSTLNAGFIIISKVHPYCDHIALHDIDLLPLNEEISYAYPGLDEVSHVINPDYHPFGQVYNRDLNIGGIALISNELFIRVNGFGNTFWGWGFEDQNFSLRLKRNSIKVNRQTNLTTDRTNTFKHIHSPNRKRDINGCLNQVSAAYADPDFITGLNDVRYEMVFKHSIIIDGFSAALFGISIPCEFAKTPWCKPLCLGGNNSAKLTEVDQVLVMELAFEKNEKFNYCRLNSQKMLL